MNTFQKIETRLRENLNPVHLEVLDDSGRHRGHAGASGGGHYQVLVVAACLRGKSYLARHRLIQDSLRELFTSEIHALSIRAYTPEDWETLNRT